MTYANHTSLAPTPRLHAALTAAIGAFIPQTVIETGTHLGRGTTQAILDALQASRVCVDNFTTIETNPVFAALAKDRLGSKGVRVINGMSLAVGESLIALKDPYLQWAPSHVKRDHADPAAYIKELPIPFRERLWEDRWLEKLLPAARPLICLDSCGALGWLEFNTVLRLQPKPFLLFLDDIDHVKHARSGAYIASEPVRWRIYDSDGSWLIAEAL